MLKISPASWAFANCFSASALLSPLFSSWGQIGGSESRNMLGFNSQSIFFFFSKFQTELIASRTWTQTDLWWFELWGFAVKHIHRFDAVLQHADCPVEHSHKVTKNKNSSWKQQFWPWNHSVLIALSNNPVSRTLLSPHPHFAGGFRPDAQQSRTGRYTWRHQWQFSSLQNVQIN